MPQTVGDIRYMEMRLERRLFLFIRQVICMFEGSEIIFCFIRYIKEAVE